VPSKVVVGSKVIPVTIPGQPEIASVRYRLWLDVSHHDSEVADTAAGNITFDAYSGPNATGTLIGSGSIDVAGGTAFVQFSASTVADLLAAAFPAALGT
jgi:hypothetical protein